MTDSRRGFLKKLGIISACSVAATAGILSLKKEKEYYIVDGINGDDRNDGKTAPWKTVEPFAHVAEGSGITCFIQNCEFKGFKKNLINSPIECYFIDCVLDNTNHTFRDGSMNHTIGINIDNKLSQFHFCIFRNNNIGHIVNFSQLV